MPRDRTQEEGVKMIRVTYHDEYLTVTDVLVDGQLVARRILLRSEFGGVEKEYHKVFQGHGVEDVHPALFPEVRT